jgi:AcrR family transcriptional regulator
VTQATSSRRPPGTSRVLLLDAARELFARKDYRSTTTKEIAVAAGVAEHLLFRNFGSKAVLFREALVVPFIAFVDDFHDTWPSIAPELPGEEKVAREFLGALYDLFVEHRGLVMTLWSADILTDEELHETGIADIDNALAVLAEIGAEGLEILGMQSIDPQLAARSTVAMVAGMAAFNARFFGGTEPSRDVIVDELTQSTLHGLLHRGPVQ